MSARFIYKYTNMHIYIYIYIYIYIWNIIEIWNLSSMKHWISLQKVMDLMNLGSCPNYMNSANVVAEIQFKLLNERALSTREPCTYEYVTLLQLFHRSTSSIPWYIAQNV